MTSPDARELAAQLAAEGSQLVKGSQLTVKCATGGAPMAQQVRLLLLLLLLLLCQAANVSGCCCFEHNSSVASCSCGC
jgi:hypothetical protein